MSKLDKLKCRCGALPSLPDHRDYIAEEIYKDRKTKSVGSLKKAPETLDLRDYLQEVVDQGYQSTCAAQTAVVMKEFQEKIQVDLNKRLSPQFVYNLRSNYPGAGMHGRDVMKILTNNGVCREEIYEYGKIEPADKIPEEALEEGKNYAIAEYARVTTLEGLKQSLVKNGPCYISFPVYNYGSNFWIGKDGEDFVGGHAVAVVGYNKEGFIIRNSWGKDWGNEGYTLYPFKEWGSHWEVWTTIDGPSPHIDYLEKTKCKCIIL